MKLNVFFLTLLLCAPVLFCEDGMQKSPQGEDLVCHEIKIIAGDKSKATEFLVDGTSPKKGFAPMLGVLKCENSTSICYTLNGGAFTCHKK